MFPELIINILLSKLYYRELQTDYLINMPGLVPYPTNLSVHLTVVQVGKHLTDGYFKWQNITRETKIAYILLAVLESGANRFRVLKLSKYFQLQYMVIRNLL